MLDKLLPNPHDTAHVIGISYTWEVCTKQVEKHLPICEGWAGSDTENIAKGTTDPGVDYFNQ